MWAHARHRGSHSHRVGLRRSQCEPGTTRAFLLTRGQAVKSVAIARKHMRDSGTELLMAASFPVASRSSSVVLELSRCSDLTVEALGEDDSTNLVVKPASDPPKVAGAVSNRTREGQVVRLVARGKESVMIAVESLVAAVNYLKDERRLLIAPRFIETESLECEERLTMICFDVLSQECLEPQGSPPESAVPHTELKVAATSEPKKVSKAITGRMEKNPGSPLTVLASGSASVNQAVKAVAIARQVLRDNETELVMSAAFPVASRSTSVVFTLSTANVAVEAAAENSTSLTVKPASQAAKVAGAIAGRSREGEVVQLVARGKESVMVAVEALAAAVNYLEADDLQLLIAPRFIQSEQDNGTGGKVTLMSFDILAQPTN
eukprot:TRINITY_DN4101_c0_g1_i5.p1 TRINITY_DN4101_c0_g1~~TRINITY_DN4101_c0_g1_i5.p1  ORF type:complete len:378 (-),score=73.74 TRINITY_DN4101_c0_g1_i5:399-1532(-)